jgi:hypothetical protein
MGFNSAFKELKSTPAFGDASCDFVIFSAKINIPVVKKVYM